MEAFLKRHLGINENQQTEMLKRVGVKTLKDLCDEIVPLEIRTSRLGELPPALSEPELLAELKSIAHENANYKSYIGMGYYNTHVPSVIKRNLFENPGWYTSYTPYQSEISQGRMESLLNFQTMVMSLTAMEVANASLLDEGTAAAEALTIMKRKNDMRASNRGRNICLVDNACFPQVKAILKTRSIPIDIELKSIDIKINTEESLEFDDEKVFGAILQYPGDTGDLDISMESNLDFLKKLKDADVGVTVVSDLMALVWLKPPGEWKSSDEGTPLVDIVVGNSQRFGVPLGYGGPHAAFMAVRDDLKRLVPGRIIGVSKDAHGKVAYRMTLQTREQHIRREKATSNICTAQALLANMAAMYAVYHGSHGLKVIAGFIHLKTTVLAKLFTGWGYATNPSYFDTLTISADAETVRHIHTLANEVHINFRKFDGISSDENHSVSRIGVSIDERVTRADLENIARIFATAKNVGNEWEKEFNSLYAPVAKLEELVRINEEIEMEMGSGSQENIIHELKKHLLNVESGLKGNIRTSEILNHEIFHRITSETQMMRYLFELERKDISLTYSMISLGSCTMKLNPATTMMPLSWEEFANPHPYADPNQNLGYRKVFDFLESALASITGMDAVSLQPNSGAQGEFAGLLAIRGYHLANEKKSDKIGLQPSRTIMLIPTSAHGTNPASAIMAGLDVVLINCVENGDIDLEDLRSKIGEHQTSLAGLMITYPSTHGIYEQEVKEICALVHQAGGQVYMDGANMNAQVGLTSPAAIGADVCHLNLHKTFAIPHGGGGPGMGPIAVKKHLAPHLPGHTIVPVNGRITNQVSSSPWGSASILLISYAYIRMLGRKGLEDATAVAMLNANYLKERLATHYPILYQGKNNRVAHEFIIDIRPFEKTAGIKAEDISKRLIDFGFHAPTMSFPIPGTLMIEPTESEDLAELDRFVEAMITIRKEIAKVESGEWSREDNPLVNAPHAQIEIVEEWKHSYSIKEGCFPVDYLLTKKYWSPVSRVDNVYGDKNFFCACPDPQSFALNYIKPSH